MTRTETKEERKRTTMTKQNTSNSSYLFGRIYSTNSFLGHRLLFLRMRYLKWMRIFKKWFNRFFLFSGMKLEFLLTTGIK